MLLARGLDEDSESETLISGGGDGTIKLWPLGSSADVALSEAVPLEHGDDSVLALALDGTVLYSGRLEGNVDVWDLDTRQLIRTVNAHQADILTLSVGHGLVFSGAADGMSNVRNPKDTLTPKLNPVQSRSLIRGMRMSVNG